MSGAFVAIDKESKQIIEAILARTYDYSEADNYFADLAAGGFIVPEESDEYKITLAKFQDAIESDELTITILPAESCNFRCAYCYEKLRHIRMSSTTQDAILKFVENSSANVNSLHIAWYGGEPTLARLTIIESMRKIAHIANIRNIPFDGSMTTNGYLLKGEYFKGYFNSGIRFFQVTIDGLKEEHDKLRILRNGRGSFDAIWRNLQEIKKINGDFLFRIRANFHGDNYQSMYKFIDLFADKFGDDGRFLLAFRPLYYSSFVDNTLPLCSIMDGARLQNDLMSYTFNKLKRMENIQVINPLPQPIGTWCPAQKINYFLIGADGALWKCDLAANYIEMKVGDLAGNGQAILNKEKIQKWIDSGIYLSDSKCAKCKFLPICQGGCVYNRLKGNPTCLFNEALIRESMQSRYRSSCI
jgi:uncharacterized protein